MKKLTSTPRSYQFAGSARVKEKAWLEVGIFLLCFLLLSLLYAMPSLVGAWQDITYLKELLVDFLFMVLSFVPAWWLHFRKLTNLTFKKRLIYHILTAAIFYCCWLTLYRVYNPAIGKPVMTPEQMVRNIGPNLIFYVQVFSILHIYHFFRERERQLKKEQELSSLAYNSEINALKAQIQPHFLFNTLNSISASVSPQQENTRVLIAKLADTFRYALNSTREDLVPLSSELDFINSYLSLEKERFKERLQVLVEAEEAVIDAMIPPMLLQPLVENALKHGIEPALKGGIIHIVCKKERDGLLISIYNTGIQFKGALDELFQGAGVGLKNTATRLERLYDQRIEVERNEPTGLRFFFHLPLIFG